MSWQNFNDADKNTEFDLIPSGTLVKLHLKLRPGGHNDPEQGWTNGVATRNDKTGAVYINGEFTVMGGKYNKRKVFTLIGLHSPKGPTWANMGRTMIRAILESARNVDPDDMSEKAMNARRISSLEDLDGLEFAGKIGVDKGTDGHDDKNTVAFIIPSTHKDYPALMNGSAASDAPPVATAAAASSAKATSELPAWAQ